MTPRKNPVVYHEDRRREDTMRLKGRLLKTLKHIIEKPSCLGALVVKNAS
jgi:hypothetical protein